MEDCTDGRYSLGKSQYEMIRISLKEKRQYEKNARFMQDEINTLNVQNNEIQSKLDELENVVKENESLREKLGEYERDLHAKSETIGNLEKSLLKNQVELQENSLIFQQEISSFTKALDVKENTITELNRTLTTLKKNFDSSEMKQSLKLAEIEEKYCDEMKEMEFVFHKEKVNLHRENCLDKQIMLQKLESLEIVLRNFNEKQEHIGMSEDSSRHEEYPLDMEGSREMMDVSYWIDHSCLNGVSEDNELSVFGDNKGYDGRVGDVAGYKGANKESDLKKLVDVDNMLTADKGDSGIILDNKPEKLLDNSGYNCLRNCSRSDKYENVFNHNEGTIEFYNKADGETNSRESVLNPLRNQEDFNTFEKLKSESTQNRKYANAILGKDLLKRHSKSSLFSEEMISVDDLELFKYEHGAHLTLERVEFERLKTNINVINNYFDLVLSECHLLRNNLDKTRDLINFLRHEQDCSSRNCDKNDYEKIERTKILRQEQENFDLRRREEKFPDKSATSYFEKPSTYNKKKQTSHRTKATPLSERKDPDHFSTSQFTNSNFPNLSNDSILTSTKARPTAVDRIMPNLSGLSPIVSPLDHRNEALKQKWSVTMKDLKATDQNKTTNLMNANPRTVQKSPKTSRLRKTRTRSHSAEDNVMTSSVETSTSHRLHSEKPLIINFEDYIFRHRVRSSENVARIRDPSPAELWFS